MAHAIVDIIRQQIKAAPVTDLDRTPLQMRAAYDASCAGIPIDPKLSFEPANIPQLDARWLVVEGQAPPRTVLFLHGGGYVIGSADTHRELMGRVARAADARVLGLNYRLAPEHPYPAALEDALAAYRWLVRSGTDPGQIVLAGDSAGGGLALSTCLALRDSGDPLPAALVLLSPWVDLRCGGDTFATADDPIVELSHVQMLAGFYAGDIELADPRISPALAELAGLPPIHVQVGEAEALRSDVEAFAAKAKASGIELELLTVADMIHAFHSFAFMLPEAAQAIEQFGAFIEAHTPAL